MFSCVVFSRPCLYFPQPIQHLRTRPRSKVKDNDGDGDYKGKDDVTPTDEEGEKSFGKEGKERKEEEVDRVEQGKRRCD